MWLPLWDDYLEFYRETLAPEQTALTFDRLVEDLFVHPAARGRGTGRALITHVEDWARKPGAHTCTG